MFTPTIQFDNWILARRQLDEREPLPRPPLLVVPERRDLAGAVVVEAGPPLGREAARVQPVDVLEVPREREVVQRLALALLGERRRLPRRHLVAARERQAARPGARDVGGLGLGDGERDDALRDAGESEGRVVGVEEVLVEAAGAGAIGDDGRREVAEEGEAVEVARAEDDGIDARLDGAVGEADPAAVRDELGDLRSRLGPRRAVLGRGVGDRLLGDNDGQGADRRDLRAQVDAGSRVADDDDFLCACSSYLVLVLCRVPVELGMCDGSRVSLVEVGQAGDVRDERVVVVTARDQHGVEPGPGRLIRSEVPRLHLPAATAAAAGGVRCLVDGQHLGGQRDDGPQLLGVSLKVLLDDLVGREQRGVGGELAVRVVHEGVRDVGLEVVVDGGDELLGGAALDGDGRVRVAGGPRPRDGEVAVDDVEGAVGPHAADGVPLLEDLHL
ncbi:hypothetical protein ColKHC_11087 [Colletotrichum higginsianum]|nr:hypothetical protein ColKHC_11087 [Colletotrichum higginsianum]